MTYKECFGEDMKDATRYKKKVGACKFYTFSESVAAILLNEVLSCVINFNCVNE